MDFSLDFDLVRSQKLLLIPQLKLALDILEMNARELSAFLDRQLELNPALEADTAYIEPAVDDRKMPSLKEHLQFQLEAARLDKTGRRIGEYLIDNTDDNGYLKADLNEVAAFFSVPASTVASVLQLLQSLDPPGICARNLKETLLIQLEQQEEHNPEAQLVVECFLEQLAQDDPETVAFETGIDAERIRDAFKAVRSLEPRPGREYFDLPAGEALPPDILMKETQSGMQVSLNSEAFPEVYLSESFREHLPEEDAALQDGLHGSLKGAIWLVKCLEQRKDILCRIALKLAEESAAFFHSGPGEMKRLDVAAFAAALDMHDSILEKALKGKSLQCKWGRRELSSFFVD